jgi:predicted amidohydrolase
MVADPAPVDERLARAEVLMAQAVRRGAQLVVLPEVFNTGYEYSDANYRRAETLSGRTVRWMEATARRHDVHLAGTFLRRGAEEIYNTLLLVAPDGRTWHYDKRYPWVWERAYFRAGEDVTVAETDLGRLGLLVCWDAAHPELWQCYAGRVDAMVVCSCPPRAHDLTVHLPDGRRLRAAEAGPILRHVKRTGEGGFGPYLRRQAAHLGVPVVNTTGAGTFVSRIPLPRLSMAVYALFRPDLWPAILRADQVRVEATYFPETYVANAGGRVLERVPADCEGCAVAEVSLADELPIPPIGPPPPFGISSFAYAFDRFANAVLAPVYRHGVRATFGRHMAPLPRRTWRWLGALFLVGTLAFLLGRRKRR